MSQASTNMAITTTPPVTVVCSGMSSLHQLLWAASMIGLLATLGQHDVVLPPPLTPRCPGGDFCLATVSHQQPISTLPPQAYAKYAMGSPQVGFFFQS